MSTARTVITLGVSTIAAYGLSLSFPNLTGLGYFGLYAVVYGVVGTLSAADEILKKVEEIRRRLDPDS